MLSLTVFIGCYLFFIFYGKQRALIASIGAILLIIFGELNLYDALFTWINWNVMGLFVGTLILAELFMLSRMPAVMAQWLVDRMPNARWAIVAICLLASFLSMAVENVAVVLLVAPVAISLCEKLKISPVDPLIYLAIFANIQGAATLIGDPPSMIVGGYLKMTFNDFFIFHDKPSVFFIIQAGAFIASCWLFYVMRAHREPIQCIPIEVPKSFVPSGILLIFIMVLATSSSLDPSFKWLAGSCAMGFAGGGVIWHYFGPRWVSTKKLLQTLDWETSIFLAALFVLVGALEHSGWIESLSLWISRTIAFNIPVTFLFVLLSSTLASAFIDNVPFLLTMLPVVVGVAQRMGASEPLFIFALLVGSCLGGNITPIGASANIVAVSILNKQGHQVSFVYYVRKVLILTLLTLISAGAVLWFIWA